MKIFLCVKDKTEFGKSKVSEILEIFKEIQQITRNIVLSFRIGGLGMSEGVFKKCI